MTVTHSAGSYEITFVDLASLLSHWPENSVVITDSNLHKCYPTISEARRCIVVPAGESSKSMATYGDVLEQLAGLGANRKSWVVAFGGGVVGDLAGFVAATYMRGVKLLQVPTSLLAMVDSSIGGKVAIDLNAGKNLAGAFYPPQQVLICAELLRTLPDRHITNGLAEVLKYGYIADPTLFELLANSTRDLNDLILRSLEIKRRIVMEDEFETTGLRATLNFGHTIGHAIEKCLSYETLLHGEAIAIGMVLEAKLGEKLGITPAGTADHVRDACANLGLPHELPQTIDAKELIAAMALDKKVTGPLLAFSLLSALGTCKLCTDVDPSVVQQVLMDQ